MLELATQQLRRFGYARQIDKLYALSKTVVDLKNSSILLATNFSMKNLTPAFEGPEQGCWFTRKIGGELFFFWHPNVNFKFSRLKVAHSGHGKDIYSKIKIYNQLMGAIVQR